jgi:hypothetical protein
MAKHCVVVDPSDMYLFAFGPCHQQQVCNVNRFLCIYRLIR